VFQNLYRFRCSAHTVTTTYYWDRRRSWWAQADDDPVALVVVVDPSACLIVPPGTSLNIGDHHQQVSRCGGRARQHSVVYQHCRLNSGWRDH
jgi:hypothetical protein